jgi:hypothetical protein
MTPLVAEAGAPVVETRAVGTAHAMGDHLKDTDEHDPATVEAVGKISEALETVERARGHLYAFHQLTGTADLQLEEGIGLLRAAGHGELADRLERDLLGRNVIPGHWTFQIMEEYDDTYWSLFRELERTAREELAGGVRHLYEARLKQSERSAGLDGHAAHP